MHFTKMHKSIKDVSMDRAQLGLGHSYSRAKVKFNVHRVDNMIIQAISLLDQIDKDINTFAMRIRSVVATSPLQRVRLQGSVWCVVCGGVSAAWLPWS